MSNIACVTLLHRCCFVKFGGGQRAYVVGEMYGVLPGSRGEFMRSRTVSGSVATIGVDHFADSVVALWMTGI